MREIVAGAPGTRRPSRRLWYFCIFVVNERTELLRMDVRCDPAAPSAIRGAMTSLRGLGWALGDAMLVASELVTLVVGRAQPSADHWIQVQVSKSTDGIMILVVDLESIGNGDERTREDDVGLGGLGLLIVDQLARRWGTERHSGYRVWAEVPLSKG
jgi:hypothetical protein